MDHASDYLQAFAYLHLKWLCWSIGQAIDLDLLLCTGFNKEHDDLLLYLIFTQITMNDWKSESSDVTVMIAALICNKFSRNPSKFLSWWKQKVCCHCSKYTMNWNFLKRAGHSVPAAIAAHLETPCVCFCLSYQEHSSLSCAWVLPQELGYWFCSQKLQLSSGKAFLSDC